MSVNKFSSKCVVTNEESTSAINWADIVARRRTIQCDFKKSTLHEIPTVINSLVVSKVEDNKLFSNSTSTSCTCETSATKPENKDHKIIIIGDSHAQGCAVRMHEYFPKNVEVRGYVKPGVSIDILFKTASKEINSLTKKHAIILWGGSNDVGNNNSKASLRNISHYVKNNSYTNIVLIGVPHRFDLPDTSCVNKEVGPFSNKLMKIVKPFKLATLLKFEPKREHITGHGMHLNATGKASTAKLIVNWVNSVFIQKREKPFILGWKVKPNDCQPLY